VSTLKSVKNREIGIMPKLKYDESFPERAGEYAAGGMNNAEIAAKLEISEDTFYTYQRQFPAFAGAVEQGRLAVSADKIESSLMDMALGRCSTTTVRRSASGRETKTIRRLVPNLKMLIRWLERNRQYAGDGDIQTSDPVKINIPVNSKYDESFLEDVERYAAEGYTDLQIAWRLGIAVSSFYNSKKQFPEFAAALDRGRRECYGRLRCQLLALALGKCTVTTETCRDGDFRKSTERQLPPNLKAIKYWLQNMSAQGLSKVSELGGAAKDNGNDGSNENNGNKTEKTNNTSAQRHSKVSESGGCPSVYAGRMGETASARRFAKMSRKERQRLLKNRREQ
jgi:DNA-binding CsgD family transcriptional regulator